MFITSAPPESGIAVAIAFKRFAGSYVCRASELL